MLNLLILITVISVVRTYFSTPNYVLISFIHCVKIYNKAILTANPIVNKFVLLTNNFRSLTYTNYSLQHNLLLFYLLYLGSAFESA